jgi:extracellular factor (EF) 3-hydroxypalmitic acid methyl ester biosynthesis protein
MTPFNGSLSYRARIAPRYLPCSERVHSRDGSRKDVAAHRGATALLYAVSALEARATSKLGKMAYGATTHSPGSRSVRVRKTAAHFFDSVAAESRRPRIVSVACAHVRELEHCTIITNWRLGQFLGIGQDSESVAFVQRRYGELGISSRRATLKHLIGGRVDAGPQGNHSTGLFDYLKDFAVSEFWSKLIHGRKR